VGNAGRNILRANGINRPDFGLLKNFRIQEGHSLQFHANFFNATNSPTFRNEGASEVPPRKIQLGLRYAF
jgi:hypothetical protein